MLMSGYVFDIRGGVLFDTSYAYRDYTDVLFKQRIQAKKREKELSLPKSLSTFYKLCYNGGYGINSQKDIVTTYITDDSGDVNLLTTKRLQKDEQIIRTPHTHQMTNGQWLIKLKKIEGSCAQYCDQSPCQIGAAVTAVSRHHMNLSMFELAKRGLVGYTDTDSMAIYSEAIDSLITLDNGIHYDRMYNESAEAPMGTYKNDHEEGDDEIIFLSLFIAKKVKLHFTLDAQGIIRLYPTFKGYTPSHVHIESGEHIEHWELERLRVIAIINAYFDGYVGGLTQTEFKRSVNNGITIDNKAKFSASMKAFVGSAGMGSFFRRVGLGNDHIEYLVPHGSGPDIGRQIIREEEGEEFFPFFANIENEPACPRSNVQMPPRRAEVLLDKFGLSKEVLLEFVDQFYYTNYGHQTIRPEIEKERAEIQRVFNEAPKLQKKDYEWKLDFEVNRISLSGDSEVGVSAFRE